MEIVQKKKFAKKKMKVNIEKAKKLFMEYGGSHFGMGRECVYDEYLRYNVSKSQELLWIKEYQTNLLEELNKDPNETSIVSRYSGSVSDYKNYEALEPLITFTKENMTKLCSFSKLRYAEEIFRATAAKRRIVEGDVFSKARKISVDLLYSVIKEPIAVSSRYKKESLLKDVISDQSILDRASANLEKMNKTESSLSKKGRNRGQ
jgi:hypothetical protein